MTDRQIDNFQALVDNKPHTKCSLSAAFSLLKVKGKGTSGNKRPHVISHQRTEKLKLGSSFGASGSIVHSLS